MGALESSKAHALATNEGAKTGSNIDNNKGKKDPDWKKGPNPKSSEDTSNPKWGTRRENQIAATVIEVFIPRIHA
jgi:hypothetical protein